MKESENLSDQRLILLIAQSNERAFTLLFDKYWEPLSNAAFKVLKDQDAAQDIVQEIFVDLWRKRAGLSVDHVSSYLFTAVKYRVINYIQKNEVPMTSLDFVDVFRSLNSTEELINMKELDSMLQETIAELPDQCRRVFKMSRFEGFSNKEIAEKLGISVRTVENHIAVAIRILRKSVKDSILLLMLCYYLQII